MKKQFFRVKQLADQTFSRAGKTEVLSDDLQYADRKVEYIRTACHKTSKNLSSGLVTQGQDPAAKEKRLKKYPEYLLSLAMSESCACTTDECLLRSILSKCSRVEMELANESFEHELNVETKVVTPLNEIIDHEVPNILKHKRNLQKLILDMDSARTRQQTTKAGSKSEEMIKEELEDAEQKVEQCRDQLASEMFMLISKEAELAQSVFLHVKLQREYHKSALTILDEIIPELEADISDSKSKPVYHFPLEEHLRVTGRKIAFPIELCVCALLELGMQEEGLFRVAAGTSKLRRMKLSFDACCLNLSTALEYGDPHVIAGALKSYLRELPEPLMTSALYGEWMAAAKITETDSRLNALWDVIHKLPDANRENLRYLIKFLAELTKSQSVNKMTPQNIAIVIAPNLIWSPTEETTNIGMNMNMANMYSSIVDTLITYCDWFFKGENKFYLTCQQEPREREKEKETSQINGMTKSVGPITATITQQDDLDYYGHVRSNSSDTNLINLNDESVFKRTQSNSSLSDSPPHGGSPKPATRRKNKPAPIPPAVVSTSTVTPEKPPRPAVPPVVSTLPRPAKKALVDEARTVISHPITIESSKFIAMEKQTKGVNTDHFSVHERNNQTRRSFDCEPSGSKSHENHNLKIVKPQDHDSVKKFTKENENFKLPDHEFTKPLKPHAKGDDNKVSVKNQDHNLILVKGQNMKSLDETNVEGIHACSTILIPTTVAAISGGKVNVNSEPKSLPFQMSGSSTLDRKRIQRPVPVAAPRSTLADVKGSGPSSDASKSEPKDDLEGVTLRRPLVEGDRSNKPAIPERPTILQRPPSTGAVKTPRNSAELDALPDAGPSLERIHMYNVDKQQVSIIQVGGEREKDKTAVASESEVTPSPPGSDAKVEKPDRPPKPEVTQVLPPLPLSAPKTKPPSHVRTLSEGNIIDAVADSETGKPPPSPGATAVSRPPRPTPPPPPTVKPRGEGGPGESTDL